MSVDLLALAKLAVDDHAARYVLADAIEETGWWDARIHYALSNGDDREEFLALLTWPGDTGEHHARIIVEAMTHRPLNGRLSLSNSTDITKETNR